ncbi:hypothetical protein Mgra_00009344 [Meloidogyne graminicola]|uniref:Uncharacterized protein n=2 Tax=Meloidogyne TaxID=189290 RepID=A0A8S9Z835_9BILA|nr:hypothetical protein Mgra_00009344 [Meloidogyne graminicola]
MGNSECRLNTGSRACSEEGTPAISLDSNFPTYNETTINRGTVDSPKPQLRFHSVCGTNIILLRDGRIAKRRESFCKGLAFSNRPIDIGEIVCIKLCEVGTNWSGVMSAFNFSVSNGSFRFGVTNVDPASFRDIELPKLFACPDLTSKGDSVQGLILHFFINESGEMHYGVNGVHKGLFLSGINVNSKLWTIVDIYGNSVAVEFVDSSEFQHERKPTTTTIPSPPTIHNTTTPTTTCSLNAPLPTNINTNETMTSSRSTNNLRNVENSTSRVPTTANNTQRLRFHSVKGNNVVIQNNGTTAVRKHGEYYLGYVFTERPIRIGEKMVILVSMTEDAFSGSLAFGLTSCDPIKLSANRLPSDSDELLERPEYWVCIKDVGAMPQVGTTLNFKVDTEGRVFFSKNDAPFRVIMHVDVSIPLWAFFDLYGNLDQPLTAAEFFALREHRASSEGAASAHSDANNESLNNQLLSPPRLSRPSSAQWNMESLRVALPETLSITPPTQTEAVSTTNNTTTTETASTSFPSSSAPSSSSLFHDRDLEALRVANTLHRLNQQRSNLLNEATCVSSILAGITTTTRPAFFPSSTNTSSTTNSPSSYSSPLRLSFLDNNESPGVNELLSNYRQIQRDRMQQHNSRSPVRPINNGNFSQRGNVASNNVVDLFEFPNAPTINNSGASITVNFLFFKLVPLLPPPLFSSLDVHSSNEQQNLRNRVAEFEAALSSNLSSDHSPNRRFLNEVNRQSSGEGKNDSDAAIKLEDGDRNNECTICMTNRVIYRCGHMCMCFPCAKETHRRSGDCPICRTPIIDVIRCYPV